MGRRTALRRGHVQHRADVTETYGQDLGTGAPASEQEYRAKAPRGRAFLHAADYHP